MSLRTHTASGLVFYVSDAQEDDFMALFLAHGKLVFTFNVGEQRVKVKSLEKYNDGAWHDVSLQLQVRVAPSSAFPTTDDSLRSCSRLYSRVTAAAAWAA